MEYGTKARVSAPVQWPGGGVIQNSFSAPACSITSLVRLVNSGARSTCAVRNWGMFVSCTVT
eukprot:879510-Amphidinium_carterae.1